ncbi:MAG: RNA methyltransferase [Flavobacteriales bacterium]|nr:RNA methyltransferase [Flavobacteriales bacterium]MCB9198161.1 RNA methyltransferase [Flavobacteriales bacterium]
MADHDDIPYSKEFSDFLTQFLTPERKEIMNKVLEDRTRFITVVIEDIFQPQNASAVVRTCDCFGIQDVHIIEKRNKFKINPNIDRGGGQWVNVLKYNDKSKNNTVDCITQLKQKGYKVLATSPHTNDTNLYDLDLDSPVALVFGNEKLGISEDVRQHADGLVRIPMYGFTESFNISVSAALCLSVLSEKLRKSNLNWKLTDDEKTELLFEWTKIRVGSVDKYLFEYNRMQTQK